MRKIFILTLTLFVAVAAFGMLSVLGRGPDPYANISTATDKITNAEYAVGDRNNTYAEIAKGGKAQYLELDMGEGEEGTGSLVVFYKVSKDLTIQIVLWGIDDLGARVELGRKEILLEAEGNSVIFQYEDVKNPYRYVQFFAAEQAYQIDAVKAQTFRPDSDLDGLTDEWELQYGLNPLQKSNDHGADGDPDGDFLNNKQEFELGTHPLKADTDEDELPDKWEYENHLDPLNGGNGQGKDGDPDQDGLLNHEERNAHTDPQKPDTDGDGLKDGEEVYVYHTDPNKKDTDGDGLNDAKEIEKATNPLASDTDGDGLPDGWEINNQLDALSPEGINGAAGDPDQDGLSNLAELEYKTAPNDSDSDDDDLNDAEEITIYQSDPTRGDTDGDGLSDGWERQHGFNMNDAGGDNGANGDPDFDKVSNLREYQNNTNPHLFDTDADNLPDLWEITHCLNPLSSEGDDGPNGDPDKDGVINIVEMGAGESPTLVCTPS